MKELAFINLFFCPANICFDVLFQAGLYSLKCRWSIRRSKNSGQINMRKKRKVVGGIASPLPQLNDLRILHIDGGRNKNIIQLETEKEPAISVEGGRIAMMGILHPESVR